MRNSSWHSEAGHGLATQLTRALSNWLQLLRLGRRVRAAAAPLGLRGSARRPCLCPADSMLQVQSAASVGSLRRSAMQMTLFCRLN
jgi:hypothetical protein